MTQSIRQAVSAPDFEAFGALIREYVDWCRARYSDQPWFFEAVFGYQALDRELEGLSSAYGPPRGKALLAVQEGQVWGAVAYRRLSGSVCEMKRMFVPARFHGKGLGRRLCQAIVDQARADGFSTMRLDTAKDFVEALGLYRSIGFADCAPYVDYPEPIKPMIVFLEMGLTEG